MAEEKIWSISEVNSTVKDVIEGAFVPFWLEGEISNITLQRSGHVYMTLKDASSQIRTVYFGGASVAAKLALERGTMIEVFGRLSVYQPRGEYQFSVSKLRPKGIGDLHKKFEETKEKLRKEGLFDQARKKKIPLLPLRIGIVTSPEGAAIKDFLKIINRRFPNLHIRIYPSAVQGKNAEKEIADGIRFFNKTKFPDVIIITRGGGSIEDLWAFNEESLARSIAESEIPVISAVGHEIDYTIADFAADFRAPTPSAAAELVIAKEEEFTSIISDMKYKMKSFLQMRVEKTKNVLIRLVKSAVFTEPLFIIKEKQQMMDDLSGRLENSIKTLLDKKKSSLQLACEKMSVLNPLNVLQRGYSILKRKQDSSIITDSETIPEKDRIIAILAKGQLELELIKKIKT
jgi:exodeoxyribonuclease VII large subunit